MRAKILGLIFCFVLIISLSCGDSNSNNELLPPDFDLLTSECPAEDIKNIPYHTYNVAWLCTAMDGSIDLTDFGISFATECDRLQNKVTNFCDITPIGRAIFTATNLYNDIQPTGTIIASCDDPDSAVLVEELVCEIVEIEN